MALIFGTNKRKKGNTVEYTDTGGGESYIGVNKATTNPQPVAYEKANTVKKAKTTAKTPTAEAKPQAALPASPSMTELYSGYTPSAEVLRAREALESIAPPAAYSSRYAGRIDELMNKIQNREPFSYNFNTDPLYAQYRDKYTREGELAMMDTMGTAAGLTGGYGSSYATTAGSQAYQSYLGKLNDVLPSLVGAAYQRYTDQGAELYDRLSALSELENADYSRYRDSVSDYQSSRSYAATLYSLLYEQDYERYSDSVEQANTDREFAYKTALAEQKNTKSSSGSSGSSKAKASGAGAAASPAQTAVKNTSSLKGMSASAAADVLAYRNDDDYSAAIEELNENRDGMDEDKYVAAMRILKEKLREKTIARDNTYLPDITGKYTN